jgi:hypothetical protein
MKLKEILKQISSLELIFVCLLFLTMPTLNKTYLFIYLFIYSASSLSKMAADSVLSYKPRFEEKQS